jgi:hypothetical protein
MANACGACQFRIVGLHPFPPVEPIRAIRIQGTDMHRRPRGTICPRFASKFCPSKREGAGNAGCALHPRSRVHVHKKVRTRAYRAAEAIRHSLRNGFTAYSAFSPVIGLSCHRRLADTSAKLDASVEASGPHDFAVRIRAVRQRRIRVHRSLSHVRDDGRRPSSRDRMAIDVPLICQAAKAKYF